MSDRAPSRAGDDSSLDELYTQHLAVLQDGYAAALEEHGYDAVILHAGVEATQDPFDDQYWPLRPTPAYRHWLPWAKSGAAVLVQAGKRPALFYAEVDDFWHSELPPESDHFWAGFDEQVVTDDRPLAAAVAGVRAAFIGSSTAPAEALGVPAEAINPAPLLAALDQVRARKTAYERECIARANRRAAAGHDRVRELFLAGDCSELELHLAYLEATGQDDLDTPYKNIVAMDEHAAILHHVCYGRERPRGKNRSLLIDAGATCLGYASDITRTYVKGTGVLVDTFRRLIDGVTALQAEIYRRIEHGLAYEALHDQAHEILAPLLIELGIAPRASAEELVASGATRAFLPHGLGHSLGLQVHDVGCRPVEPRPDNPYLRNTSTIAAGQVFTIEPGCYFIDALLQPVREQPVAASIDWELVAELSHFGGVRIEDNLAVLEDGWANLTRDNWPDAP
ncbi:Xaa-Pro dipeptidase [Haliangium sp.]|uniref:Xaa-Pro dipeptidase n=1 Tax=Haliangium sp. TaxID=2663208 RepID=UPI003D108C1E